MKNRRYKLARRIIEKRRMNDRKRDKIGLAVLLSFVVAIATTILAMQ